MHGVGDQHDRQAVVGQRGADDAGRPVITLKNLDRVARAMDAEWFYAFVPRRSFDEIVREQAERLANQVVDRVETSMSLEDQATQPDSQRQRKLDLVNEYLRSTPRELWDQS